MAAKGKASEPVKLYWNAPTGISRYFGYVQAGQEVTHWDAELGGAELTDAEKQQVADGEGIVLYGGDAPVLPTDEAAPVEAAG